MPSADVFVCWGAAGHARVLNDVLAERGARCVAYIDHAARTDSFDGYPLFASQEAFACWLLTRPQRQALKAVFAIGRQGGHRLFALQTFASMGIAAPVICSSLSMVSDQATLGDGSQILPMAVVASHATVGRVCIINHGAIVDHECVLGDGVHMAPRATLCGAVNVGHDVFIGAGAVVLPRINLGEGAMVGAGAVVTRDVPPGATVVGNPAKIFTEQK